MVLLLLLLLLASPQPSRFSSSHLFSRSRYLGWCAWSSCYSASCTDGLWCTVSERECECVRALVLKVRVSAGREGDATMYEVEQDRARGGE